MALKNLLVIVDPGKQTTVRIDAALLLASRFGAHLTGLFVIAPPLLPGYVAPELSQELIDMERQLAQDAADRAALDFRSRVERAGTGERAEWRLDHGDPDQVAGLAARYADLIIVGQIDPDRDRNIPAFHPEDILLAGGRPVLMVPYAGNVASLGERIVIAWNGSREAARAVNDALPLLETANRVTVLVINPETGFDGPEAEPGADIALHLVRHGVKADVDRVSARGMDPADLLLNYVADNSADLLVMGGYGRSRLRELVLGGFTRHILRHMTLPVLMSH
jgi:nucleotide-binding universal stress UspA family protein